METSSIDQEKVKRTEELYRSAKHSLASVISEGFSGRALDEQINVYLRLKDAYFAAKKGV